MSFNNCSIMNLWSHISYPGKCFTPIGETPNGGSWPLIYFKRVGDKFEDLKGNAVCFDIKVPQEADGFNTTELEEVIKVCNTINEEQKEIARYWGAGVPLNQFIPVIQCLINTYGVQPIIASRIWSVFSNAMNDTMIICWYYKYKFQIPRPVQYERTFKPFLTTPFHPSYPAGHAVGAGCMEGILSYYFPKEGEKIKKLAEECCISRIYAGVHYMLDLDEGYKLGKDIAKKIIEQIKEESDSEGCKIDIIYENFKDAKIYPPSYKQMAFCNNSGC